MSGKKGLDILNKKVPQNPKYKHVQATIDTGASMTKHMERIADIQTNYKFKKGEIFRRMKITTFVQLVCQVSEVNSEANFDSASSIGESLDDNDREVQGIQEGGESPAPSSEFGGQGDYEGQDTARSTLISVAQGVGEMDLNTPAQVPPLEKPECPYLLLDVRTDDEYKQSHIITAVNYPKAMLSRACNFESAEMIKFKNKPGKIIIVCDADEKLGPLAATTLVERGYENLFMLSGGMKVAFKLFPESLITGTVPTEVTQGKPVKITNTCLDTFDDEDINRLTFYLDRALTDNSTGSRLSKMSSARSSVTARSSVSARSTASTSSRKPAFK